MSSKPVVHTPMLQGLSKDDRDLMLAMMAALGSAASTLMAGSQMVSTIVTLDEDGPTPADLVERMDAEVNAIIDLCKTAKDRLKPGHAIILN